LWVIVLSCFTLDTVCCFSFRPNSYCSGTGTPSEGLCVGGVSTYPAGPVLGGPGYLAANKIAGDPWATGSWKPAKEMERYIRTYAE